MMKKIKQRQLSGMGQLTILHISLFLTLFHKWIFDGTNVAGVA